MLRSVSDLSLLMFIFTLKEEEEEEEEATGRGAVVQFNVALRPQKP